MDKSNIFSIASNLTDEQLLNYSQEVGVEFSSLSSYITQNNRMDKSFFCATYSPKHSTLYLTCPPVDPDAFEVEMTCYSNKKEFLSIGHETGEGFWPYYDLTVEQTKMLHCWLGECLEKFGA